MSIDVSTFLRTLFAALDSIEYAVMRNYETLPDRVPGTDIDILIAPSDRRRALRLIDDAARDCGWRVCWRYAKNYRIDHVVAACPPEEDGSPAPGRIHL